MKKYITNLLILFGIMVCMLLVWRGLELWIDGVITSRKVDNIIGTTLTLSLYRNFKNWVEKQTNK
ncbi:hypothetical protein [Hathewaya massiliensis]|uniref:hypothetical protein n=1 Tax=Hathewaya massiliensis TaxID=1964382 RepID=UPI001158BEFF|nr:hypothetical protein [Hathewaya massiliensis]